MRIAVFDAWSGVSGDMWVAAMLDAGLPLEPLAAAVRSLRLPGVAVRAERVLRASLTGTRFVVDVATGADHGGAGGAGHGFVPLAATAHLAVRLPERSGHVHRGLGDIEAIVGRADLPARVAADCLRVYRAIAEVEARAHGTTVQEVHFHEVGAEDTIVDVVCACLAVHLLGIERIQANGVEVGTGTVRAAHGVLPVPAPATAALLHSVPVRQSLPGERTTPTGAALLRTLAHGFDQPVTMVTTAIGYGAGTRDDADVPNLLRVRIGDLVEPHSPTDVVELQCQLDTITGEEVGWLLGALLERGALDAFATPVTMKKGRPGLLLTVLCEPAQAQPLTAFLLEESSTLGVREQRAARHVLERWQETRATPFGSMRFKCARLPDGAVLARPEHDDLVRVAAERGIGLAEVRRRLLG